MALTETAIRKAKPTVKTQRLYDGAGLYLEISPAGGKWWRWKYRFGGKEKRLSPGFQGFYAYPTAAQLSALAGNGPFIARLGGNPGHFVVVESISSGTVRFFDPAGGVLRSQTLNGFAGSVSGLIFK
jgi:hypothetical protein